MQALQSMGRGAWSSLRLQKRCFWQWEESSSSPRACDGKFPACNICFNLSLCFHAPKPVWSGFCHRAHWLWLGALLLFQRELHCLGPSLPLLGMLLLYFEAVIE